MQGPKCRIGRTSAFRGRARVTYGAAVHETCRCPVAVKEAPACSVLRHAAGADAVGAGYVRD